VQTPRFWMMILFGSPYSFGYYDEYSLIIIRQTVFTCCLHALL